MVVTNSYFTASAKELANANGIGLIDRNELKKLINRIDAIKTCDKTVDIDSHDSIEWRLIGNALYKLIKYGKQ